MALQFECLRAIESKLELVFVCVHVTGVRYLNACSTKDSQTWKSHNTKEKEDDEKENKRNKQYTHTHTRYD